MGDPDLAMAFSNPNVQRAVVDISANPMNIVNYQNDPDVMKARLFAPPGQTSSSHAFDTRAGGVHLSKRLPHTSSTVASLKEASASGCPPQSWAATWCSPLCDS